MYVYTYIHIHTYRDVNALDELIEDEELDLNQKISDTMGGHTLLMLAVLEGSDACLDELASRYVYVRVCMRVCMHGFACWLS